MRQGRDRAGFTLLEVIIASIIFALLIVMTMSLLSHSLSTAEMDILQTHVENQVQDAVDVVVQDLKETSPRLRTTYAFAEGGFTQTAICFPTARNQATGAFIYKKGTVVQSSPVWQAMEIVCYVKNPNRNDGWVYKYFDYSTTRNYANPVTVTSITSSQIRLSDNTTISRLGALAGNQKRVQVQGRFLQIQAQMPCQVCSFMPLPATLVCPSCGASSPGPMQLTVRSSCEHQAATLRGSTVVTTLTNEALSRNEN